jgi:protein TonB
VVSTAAHVAVASAIALAMALGNGPTEKIDIEVIESPKAAPPSLDLSQQPKPPPPKPKEPEQRKVFGISRKALTSDEPGAGVAVKQGNTVAKDPDSEKLRPGDADSLPIPTDEFLVSKMPSILSEFKIPYPAEARQKKIEGRVVMELLIDAQGAVRDARLISSPSPDLGDAAVEAVKRFKFRPAEVEGKPVAVKTRFTYNFVLEK